MANSSKNKGKAWERDVAKLLTGIYGVNFQRVPNSGAFVGMSNAFRLKTLTPEQQLLASGDIILPRFLSHLSIECKFYGDFGFEMLLTNNRQLNGWLEQASVGGKIPLVIFKVNRKGGFIVFPYSIMNSLNIDGNFLIYKPTTSDIVYTVMKFEGFIENNKDKLVALNADNYKLYTDAFTQNNTRSSTN